MWISFRSRRKNWLLESMQGGHEFWQMGDDRRNQACDTLCTITILYSNKSISLLFVLQHTITKKAYIVFNIIIILKVASFVLFSLHHFQIKWPQMKTEQIYIQHHNKTCSGTPPYSILYWKQVITHNGDDIPVKTKPMQKGRQALHHQQNTNSENYNDEINKLIQKVSSLPAQTANDGTNITAPSAGDLDPTPIPIFRTIVQRTSDSSAINYKRTVIAYITRLQNWRDILNDRSKS